MTGSFQGFGRVSSTERRDADLFFADLIGRSRSGGVRARGRNVGAGESFAEWLGESGGACPPAGPIPSRCMGVRAREVVDCFEHGRHAVLPRHQPTLVNLARCIIASQSTATPITTLRVVGHADTSGGGALNDALGQRRADAVKASLEATLSRMTGGRPPTVTITTSTRGERDPVSGDPALSRRVELLLPAAFTPSPTPPVTPTPAAPPAPPVPPFTGPPFRPCCMLASSFLLDASSLGAHNTNGGIVYTGGAGFVDMGHVRDVADLTAFVYQQIHAASGASGTRIICTEGEARLTRALTPSEWLEVARSIAFDDAMGHEISSYSGIFPGGHNSSFSPEDLCSNYLGTVVAERALRAGGTFATVAQTQLQSMLTSLGVQSLIETRAAFALISGNWVSGSFMSSTYLRRRNFSRTPVKAGHSSDRATPAFVTAAFAITTIPYTYRNTSGFTRVDFPREIARIRADARTRYGATSELP